MEHRCPRIWYRWVDLGESGHAHKCLYDDTYDAAQPHTPDHEGGATFDYAVKCTECQHVIGGTVRRRHHPM